MEQLEDKHRMETAQKLSSQQQQRDQLNEKIAKDVENDALKKNVKVGHLTAIYLIANTLKSFIHLSALFYYSCALLWYKKPHTIDQIPRKLISFYF